MAHKEHFHVLVGLCGLYLPDRNILAWSRSEAQVIAHDIAEEFRDEGEHVSGSARDGYLVGSDYCIETTSCDDTDCLRDLDDDE
jgi:hypothetical protein